MNNKKTVLISSILVAILVILLVLLLMVKPTYTVSFETNGGTTIEEQKLKKGEKVEQPHDPIKEGYAFAEWTYGGKTYDFSKPVTSNITLEAKWIEIESNLEKIIVKFNSDGGTTIPNQILEKGSKVVKPSDPSKEGYKFLEWVLEDKTFDFNKEVENNIELKAKWEKVEEKTTNNTEKDKKTTTKKATIKNENKTTKPATTTSGVKKYTISFNSNGGSAVASQTIKEGGKVTKPQNPTKSGYTFVGWTLGGNLYDFDSSVKANMTLVAKWNENVKEKYTVTFNSNGGTSVASQTVTEGGKVSKPQNPTKKGYKFAGWLLGEYPFDFNLPIKTNVTLTAKWTQKSYSIRMTAVDDQSLDRRLTVYEEGTVLSSSNIQEIKLNGYTLCYGSNMVVNKYELKSGNTVTIILTGGVSVTGSVQ